MPLNLRARAAAFGRRFKQVTDVMAEAENQLYKDARRLEDAQARTRRRRWLRSRGVKELLALGARLAGVLGIVFPVIFAIGWLHEAGRLAGFGVPLTLLAPDPAQLAASAAVVSISLGGAVAILAGMYVGAARLSFFWRAVIYLALVLAMAFLFILYVLGRVDESAFFVPFLLLTVIVFGRPAVATFATSRRELLGLLFAIVLIGPFPVGWVTAVREASSPDLDDAVTVTLNAPVAGLKGSSIGSACAYSNLLLVRLDANTVVFRRPSRGGVWVVPSANVASIAIGSPEVTGDEC
jgi:hypothetical protein